MRCFIVVDAFPYVLKCVVWSNPSFFGSLLFVWSAFASGPYICGFGRPSRFNISWLLCHINAIPVSICKCMYELASCKAKQRDQGYIWRGAYIAKNLVIRDLRQCSEQTGLLIKHKHTHTRNKQTCFTSHPSDNQVDGLPLVAHFVVDATLWLYLSV